MKFIQKAPIMGGEPIENPLSPIAARSILRHVADRAQLDGVDRRERLGVRLHDVAGTEKADLQSRHEAHLGTIRARALGDR